MRIALNPLAVFPLSSWFNAVRLPRWTAAQRLVPVLHGPVHIEKGATLVVERALGASVSCVSGSLWITHDYGVKDIVIGAGDTYLSDRSSRMLVHGLFASTALIS
jgi:hypothetical protein